MDVPQDKLRLRQVGRGFIICNDSEGAVIGRRLTRTYLDQNDRTYVKVNGQLELLTEQHGYLAVD